MATKKTAYVNNEILKWARGETPFQTTVEVASRYKILDSEKIDKWEKGEEYPSINEARILAKLYRVPLACFYLTESPEREVKPYTDRRTYNNTRAFETSYELWSEYKRIVANRNIVLELNEEVEEIKIPVVGSSASIVEIAQMIRNYLNIEPPFKSKSEYKDNSFKYYRSIVENRGIMVAQVSGVDLKEMRGLSIHYNRVPIIAINNKDYKRAKTFSLFHELAHIVRKTSSLCLINFDERNDEEEKICDRIAAETLMPQKQFSVDAIEIREKNQNWESHSLQILADRYGVSIFSIIRRLHELNFIDKYSYSTIYKREEYNFKSNKEYIDMHNNKKNIIVASHIKNLNKEGYLFSNSVISAYHRGDISFGEMCGTLNVKRKYINKIEEAVMKI